MAGFPSNICKQSHIWDLSNCCNNEVAVFGIVRVHCMSYTVCTYDEQRCRRTANATINIETTAPTIIMTSTLYSLDVSKSSVVRIVGVVIGSSVGVAVGVVTDGDSSCTSYYIK